MLQWLRKAAGLPAAGPASELQVWREGGPNIQPTFSPTELDWTVPTWSELGLKHGELLVVQEHPDRLPSDLRHPRTCPEWLARRSRGAYLSSQKVFRIPSGGGSKGVFKGAEGL